MKKIFAWMLVLSLLCYALPALADAPLFTDTKTGDYIFFGTYEQDNDFANGAEPIEWLVLAKENDRILLISKYGLDSHPYNVLGWEMTWEQSTLRQWLRTDFFNAAFSLEEQQRILTVPVSADQNPNSSTNQGADTMDPIFLLSTAEANKYFASDADRKCEPTTFAKKQGASTYRFGFGWWWLRTMGKDPYNAIFVYNEGDISPVGRSVSLDKCSVRPAMWISLIP